MPLTTRIEATCAGRLARLLAAIVISAAPVHAAAAGEATGSGRLPHRLRHGSSGIRAGATDSERTARREFDALTRSGAGKGPAALAPASISALRELPNEAKFGSRCAAVGGGFSAWRLALQQDAKGLIETLARIHAESGVAVLVVPADREGAYGHYAARQLLGRRLTTTHVLDIGGGSLQIAGEKRSFAAPLGQKSWHRLLCEHLRDTTEVPCQLQPMNERPDPCPSPYRRAHRRCRTAPRNDADGDQPPGESRPAARRTATCGDRRRATVESAPPRVAGGDRTTRAP